MSTGHQSGITPAPLTHSARHLKDDLGPAQPRVRADPYTIREGRREVDRKAAAALLLPCSCPADFPVHHIAFMIKPDDGKIVGKEKMDFSEKPRVKTVNPCTAEQAPLAAVTEY
ncbi:unnamed protein product [Pleuronectes platessa]|uniref:Uncharacterized protein n=1 Tax=Pleuronectes platessa TaxID=8262 RepID=A0A9N7Z0P1_PLEPL|nr:unnamed protein product [Pleuronectes platessa]